MNSQEQSLTAVTKRNALRGLVTGSQLQHYTKETCKTVLANRQMVKSNRHNKKHRHNQRTNVKHDPTTHDCTQTNVSQSTQTTNTAQGAACAKKTHHSFIREMKHTTLTSFSFDLFSTRQGSPWEHQLGVKTVAAT